MTTSAFTGATARGNKISGTNNPRLPYVAWEIDLINGDDDVDFVNISEQRVFTLMWPALTGPTNAYLLVKVTEGQPSQRLQKEDGTGDEELVVNAIGQFSSTRLAGYAFVGIEFDATVTAAAQMQAAGS